MDVSLSPFDVSSPGFGLLVGWEIPEGFQRPGIRRGLRLRQAGEVFQQHVLNCGDSVQTLIVTLCSIASRPVW